MQVIGVMPIDRIVQVILFDPGLFVVRREGQLAQALAVDADLPDAEADTEFFLPIEGHPLAVERQAAAAEQAVCQRGREIADRAVLQRQDAQVAAIIHAAVDEVGVVVRRLQREAPNEENFLNAGQQLA